MTARSLTLVLCTLGFALLPRGVAAQEVLSAYGLGTDRTGEYREFVLGASLASVAARAATDAASAKIVHDTPALLQELEWRPSRWTPGAAAASTDSVEQIAFSFYNDQLFRIVVDYARERTEGLTDTDMVSAISEVYGPPVKRLPGTARPLSVVETESGEPVGRWGDVSHAIVLYRASSYAESFRLIVTDRTLDGAARKAATEALRLEAQGAPTREAAQQKKETSDRLAASAKARTANKKAFRP